MRIPGMRKSPFFLLLVLCSWLVSLSALQAAQKKKRGADQSKAAVRAVAVVSSNDAKLLATAGTEKGGAGGNEYVIRVWNLETLKPEYTLFGPDAVVTSLSYDEDGSLLLAGDDKGGVTAWNLKARFDRPHSADGKAPVTKVLFRQQDAIVISDQFHIWNPDAEQTDAPGRFHVKDVVDVDFNVGGALMAASGERETAIVHPGTLEVSQRLRLEHAQPVTSVTLSKAQGTGLYMATGHKDGAIEYWFAGRGERLITFRAHRGAVTHVAFYNQDQKLVSTGSDGMVRFWDLKAQKLLHSTRDSRSAITCFGITHGRDVVVTSDGSSVRVKALDPQKPKQVTAERILNPFASSE